MSEPKFVIVTVEGHSWRMDVTTGETWKLLPYEMRWAKVAEPTISVSDSEEDK